MLLSDCWKGLNFDVQELQVLEVLEHEEGFIDERNLANLAHMQEPHKLRESHNQRINVLPFLKCRMVEEKGRKAHFGELRNWRQQK